MLKAFKSLLISGFVLLNPGYSFADDIDSKIELLLKNMTIEEKVGQMTQLDVREISVTGPDGYAVVEPSKLKKIIHKYKVGSILNAAGKPMTVAQWHDLISKIQDEALNTENKIPVIYGIDSIHGATYVAGSTLFPHNIGIAASMNNKLGWDIAKATAGETRAAGIRWNFDPVLDLGREPLWPRFEETFGEDPYLIEQMGVGMIRAYEDGGLNQPYSVASTMKHFVGYGMPANGKDRTPASIPNKTLREYHLPQFQAAIDAGSASIMVNSASVNGVPLHSNKYLLTDVLRGEMGFKGVVVTDWEDIIRLHTRHRVAATPREAVKMAIDAGIDMSMVPNEMSFFEHLTALVKDGEVTEERLNKSVEVILRLKFKLGLFDNPYPEKESLAYFQKAEYKALALDSARQTMTLLKNTSVSEDGKELLPLKKSARLLIAGPAARNLGPLHGSWSYSWQGSNEARYPESTKTIAEAFEQIAGKGNVTVFGVEGFHDEKNYDTEGLVKAAEDVDYILLALGEHSYAESPGALDDLRLPIEQISLAKAAIETGKPVIVVMVQGRPRIISDIEPSIDAILNAYRPGSEGAQAIAEVIYGDYNPSGVLPFSYPQFTGDHSFYDRNFLTDVQQLEVTGVSYGGYKPQWPFGHGLSYTNFEYSGLSLGKSTIGDGDEISVSVTVTNVGKKGGKHAVLLYLSDLFATESPAVKRLKRYLQVDLQPGESERVNFVLQTNDLKYVNSKLERVVEAGEFKVRIGGLSESFFYQD